MSKFGEDCVPGERRCEPYYTGASVNTGLARQTGLEKALIFRMGRATGSALEKQNQGLYISQVSKSVTTVCPI